MLKEVTAALSKLLKNQTTKLKHFNQLQIDDDLNALSKFATGQSGQFSRFVSTYGNFQGNPDVASIAKSKKATISARRSTSDESRSKPQSVFEGKDFDAWLQIARTEVQSDTKAKAVVAIISLCESDQQVNQVLQLLSKLAESQPLYKTEKDGSVSPLQQKMKNNVFIQGFNSLSAIQAFKFLKLQLNKGTDQAVINSIIGLDEWGNARNLGKVEIETKLKPHAAELLRLANLREKPLVPLEEFLSFLKSLNDQKTNSETEGRSTVLFKGKQLNEWLYVLDVDQDPQTQAEALKACTALYLSDGQADLLMALLQSYIQRSAELHQGNIDNPSFSGFFDSFNKLPPQRAAAFFERQLKHGTEKSIKWTYRAIVLTRSAPRRRDSRDRQTSSDDVQFYARNQISEQLRDELKSNAVESLRSIAAREKGESVGYLLNFFVQQVLEEPSSGETSNLIKEILVKLDVNDLLRSARIVPKAMLTPELFDGVQAQLFAAETSKDKRNVLIWDLIYVEKSADGQATFILDILAAVISNQMYGRDRLEISELNTYEGLEEENISVVRSLLSVVCEQIVNPKTLSSKGVTHASSKSRSASRARSKQYVDQYFLNRDVDKNGILEGDELPKVHSASKYDVNRDGRIEADEMLAVIAGPSDPTPINLTSSQSRSKAAEVARRILDIIAKPSPSEQADDPIELGQYQKLWIVHDLETLKKLSKKKPGKFSDFVDQAKRKFQGDPEASPMPETEKASPSTSSSKIDSH